MCCVWGPKQLYFAGCLVLSTSLEWGVCSASCTEADLRSRAEQSPRLSIHWLMAVCCSYWGRVKAWQGRVRVLEGCVWGRNPIILLLSKVPGSGPVQRSRRGDNSQAPNTLLKKPLCRAHAREEMSEHSSGNSSRKAVWCGITLCSMRTHGRCFFCFLLKL